MRDEEHVKNLMRDVQAAEILFREHDADWRAREQPNEEHLRILNTSIDSWNKWRTDNPAIAVNLINANLIEASLEGADFHDADLRGANFKWAKLQRVKLIDARLENAIFSGTILGRADLTNCSMDATILADVDLSEVRGLETVVHQGPSFIGVETIYKSKGKIPEKFLIACGVPENLRAYLRTVSEF